MLLGIGIAIGIAIALWIGVSIEKRSGGVPSAVRAASDTLQGRVAAHIVLCFQKAVSEDAKAWGPPQAVMATKALFGRLRQCEDLQHIATEAVLLGYRTATPLDVEVVLGLKEDKSWEPQLLALVAKAQSCANRPAPASSGAPSPDTQREHSGPFTGLSAEQESAERVRRAVIFQETGVIPADDQFSDSRRDSLPESLRTWFQDYRTANLDPQLVRATEAVQQDAADFAPFHAKPVRLHPKSSLRRAIALRAYRQDGALAMRQVDELPWPEAARNHKKHEVVADLMAKLASLNQLQSSDIHRLFADTIVHRSDIADLEREARAISSVFCIVPPLCK